MDQIDKYAKIIWDYMIMRNTLKPVDAILVLGSNDTRVAERAAELYLQGYAKYIICSGGNGKGSDFNRSEAEVFSEIIIQKGVSKEVILLEPKSSNTGENIIFTQKLLQELKLNFRSFIIVTKPYMERRGYVTFKKQWVGDEVEFFVTSPQLTYEEYSKNDQIYKNRFLHVMVGDLLRIREYPKLGFQIEQEIPDQVWQAGQELIKLGYNKYIL